MMHGPFQYEFLLMRKIAYICLLFFLIEVISADELRLHKRSLCAANCRNKCGDDNCYSKCETTCSNPCNKRCRNSENCQPDPQECPEVPAERKDVLPVKQGQSFSKTMNEVNNNNKVDINPNITMTNTISNMNNISVPINVTSMNVNTIRVTSTDTRRTDTNITASPVKCPTQGCSETRKRIVILPYPFPKPEVQEVMPPVQAQRYQTVVQQPILVAPPVRQNVISHQFLPPVQRQEIVMPIPVMKPQIITIPQPPPLTQQQPFMWIPYQQDIIPQQQTFLPIQQNMQFMSAPTPCSSSSPNQPCSAQAPVYFTPPCNTPDCLNRYPYVMTSPYYPDNRFQQFGSVNQMFSKYGMKENQLQYLNDGQYSSSKDLNKI